MDRETFYTQLYAYHEEHGLTTRPPKLLGHAVDLYDLFVLSMKQGGFPRVNKNNKWSYLLKAMNIVSENERTVPQDYQAQVKAFYVKWLRPFEGERVPPELKRQMIPPGMELPPRKRKVDHDGDGDGEPSYHPQQYQRWSAAGAAGYSGFGMGGARALGAEDREGASESRVLRSAAAGASGFDPSGAAAGRAAGPNVFGGLKVSEGSSVAKKLMVGADGKGIPPLKRKSRSLHPCIDLWRICMGIENRCNDGADFCFSLNSLYCVSLPHNRYLKGGIQLTQFPRLLDVLATLLLDAAAVIRAELPSFASPSSLPSASLTTSLLSSLLSPSSSAASASSVSPERCTSLNSTCGGGKQASLSVAESVLCLCTGIICNILSAPRNRFFIVSMETPPPPRLPFSSGARFGSVSAASCGRMLGVPDPSGRSGGGVGVASNTKKPIRNFRAPTDALSVTTRSNASASSGGDGNKGTSSGTGSGDHVEVCRTGSPNEEFPGRADSAAVNGVVSSSVDGQAPYGEAVAHEQQSTNAPGPAAIGSQRALGTTLLNAAASPVGQTTQPNDGDDWLNGWTEHLWRPCTLALRDIGSRTTERTVGGLLVAFGSAWKCFLAGGLKAERELHKIVCSCCQQYWDAEISCGEAEGRCKAAECRGENELEKEEQEGRMMGIRKKRRVSPDYLSDAPGFCGETTGGVVACLNFFDSLFTCKRVAHASWRRRWINEMGDDLLVVGLRAVLNGNKQEGWAEVRRMLGSSAESKSKAFLRGKGRSTCDRGYYGTVGTDNCSDSKMDETDGEKETRSGGCPTEVFRENYLQVLEDVERLTEAATACLRGSTAIVCMVSRDSRILSDFIISVCEGWESLRMVGTTTIPRILHNTIGMSMLQSLVELCCQLLLFRHQVAVDHLEFFLEIAGALLDVANHCLDASVPTGAVRGQLEIMPWFCRTIFRRVLFD
eukprot:GHVS01058286.1.p1 GENE.GHVS01058286.1~~GHVS01058286.1.p1  ORF type:complete len:948 (+),score=108.32 GHVS01058286.1:69-2912(+)